MDQIYQLQRQIQDLQQEVNSISQVAGQLQRSEANNAVQLQRLSQNENAATQQLQAIQQLCNRLSQDVNMINSVARQITPQNTNIPFSNQFGAGMYAGQFETGQFGNYGANISAGQYSPTQYGTFGAQFGGNRSDEYSRNQQISSMAANRYGVGFSGNDYATNQYINNLANQGMLGSQATLGTSNLGAGAFGAGSLGMGPMQSGYSGTSAGNFTIQPSHPVSYHSASTPHGTSGFTGSQYMPTYGASQFSANWQPGSGFSNQSLMGMSGQNIGRYSNF
ncbi:MAG: hypothetical protein A4E55_01879 [Pelotomaculum sp. PtaU1.Bin035]|nr:MAG: hypothetical protein A4E55_01879 [Pelotomaculum sp. PtaU1.Bin035]